MSTTDLASHEHEVVDVTEQNHHDRFRRPLTRRWAQLTREGAAVHPPKAIRSFAGLTG
jgi:hypothetical protein